MFRRDTVARRRRQSDERLRFGRRIRVRNDHLYVADRIHHDQILDGRVVPLKVSILLEIVAEQNAGDVDVGSVL